MGTELCAYFQHQCSSEYQYFHAIIIIALIRHDQTASKTTSLYMSTHIVQKRWIEESTPYGVRCRGLSELSLDQSRT
jgi:hypothetical protein